jgi:hypothetical protein
MAVSGHLHTPAVSPVTKVPQYALNRRLGEPQNRPLWCVGDEKDLLQVPGIELRFLGRWAHNLTWTGITASDGEGRRKCCRVTFGKPSDKTATNSNPALLLNRLQASIYTYCCVDTSFPWGIYCWVQILLIINSSDINSKFLLVAMHVIVDAVTEFCT